jgi:hypothetical protein
MFFKASMRNNPQTGKLSGYYRLVESYRDFNDVIRHRTILTVGFMEELGAAKLNQIQKRLSERVDGLDNQLFENEPDEVIDEYVERLYRQLLEKKRIDRPSTGKHQKDLHTIDLNTLKNKDVREVGAEWMCYQAIKQLGIKEFLSGKGWEEEKTNLALTHLISRAVYPASEYKSSRWIKENSSVCEVTGYDIKKITKDRLYSISHALYEHKNALEQHLSKKTNELFDLQDKIILYDLTNTHFEGIKADSQIARFGRSKEKRSDARLVVMAVVVNPEGFIKYSTIFEGNKADCKTLTEIIDKLDLATSSTKRKALVVIDAGIATDDNLKAIQAHGYDYLCVSRTNLKDYTIDPDTSIVNITDKRNKKIALQKVTSGRNTDYYLHVKSEAKAQKEHAMNSRFKEGFETGLAQIQSGLSKKYGVKKTDKVHQRIGRLKQKYPSIQRFYLIDVESNEKGIATSLKWSIRTDINPTHNHGVYFLRTSLENPDESKLWMFYNTIREIEYTFRVLKTDLDLRPIFHQRDDSTMAHLHLGLIAYTLVNTIRYQLKQQGIRHDWREIVRIMNTQKCVTTTAHNDEDHIIQIRKCSEPEPNVTKIYDALKYKYAPFTRKKSVVLKPEIKKNEPPQNKEVMII